MKRPDSAETLFNYIRILNPGLLEGAVREHPLPKPDGGRPWRFDLAWPGAMLAVEVDGGRWLPGGGRHASPGDYRKLRQAVLQGWRVLRFTKSEVENDPVACLDDLVAALRLP